MNYEVVFDVNTDGLRHWPFFAFTFVPLICVIYVVKSAS
jgi:hypothetical protein